MAGFGILAAFADGVGHFAGLAQSQADPALLVANHHQGAEAEAPTALDHLGGAIDDRRPSRSTHRRTGLRRPRVAMVRSRPSPAAPIRAGRLARAMPASAARHSVVVRLSHDSLLVDGLKLQSGFARGVGQRLHFAVVTRSAAVEHHLADSASLSDFSRDGAEPLGARDVRLPSDRAPAAPSRGSRSIASVTPFSSSTNCT